MPNKVLDFPEKIDADFRDRLIKEVGLAGHPKAMVVWAICYRAGDTAQKIREYMEELAPMYLMS